MDLKIKRFNQPDESCSFEKGSIQLVTVGGMTLDASGHDGT